jgi:predicted ATPase
MVEREPLALLLSARPEADADLANAFPGRLAIRLTPLDERGIGELLEAILDSPPPQGLASFLGRRSAGNPFFVQELVRALEQSGTLTRVDDGRWRLSPGWDARELPLTVEEVLGGRMDFLPVATASALQTASVIGRRVPLPLLRAVATEVPDLPASLDQLVAGAFLDRTVADGIEALVFRHALVQDVAYERLLRRRRRELHCRVAEQAEALYGAGEDTIDLLARHLYLGEAGPKAVTYLRRAGDRARCLYANEEAILHLARALELVPGDEELRIDVADLHELVGNYDEALQLYLRARDEVNDVRAWRGAVSALRKKGEYPAALTLIEDALSALSEDVDESALWLDRGITFSITGLHDPAVHALEAGLSAARAHANATVEGQLLTQLARLEGSEGRGELALEHARQAQEIFGRQDDPRRLATTLRTAGAINAQIGRLPDASDALRRGLELAYRVGSTEEIAACLLNLAFVEREQGNYEGAIAHTQDAIGEFERIGHAPGVAQGYSSLAALLEESNQLDAALDCCRRAQALASSIGHKVAIADSKNTLACVWLKREEFSLAAETAEEAAALYLEVGDETQARDVLGVAADAYLRAGDDEMASDCRSRASGLVTSSV